MSHEQYTPPSLTTTTTNNNGPSQSQNQATSGSSTAAAASGGYGGFNLTGGVMEDTSRPVNYLCGDCDAKVVLRKTDPIRCKECGYRVLYKERTNRMIQFEAR